MGRRKRSSRVSVPEAPPHERGGEPSGEIGTMEDVLVQLLRSNECCFFSDLPKLFKIRRMKSDSVHIRRFGLGVWGQVLTYLFVCPTTVSGYDEVEQILRDHRPQEATSSGKLFHTEGLS